MGPKPHQPSGGGAMMNLEKLSIAELKESDQSAVNIAVDIADAIIAQAIDFAQNVIGFSDAKLLAVVALAAAHAQVSALVYAARRQPSVLREVTPEVAGAISDAGTDVGSDVAACYMRSKLP